ncbi:MAG: CopG family transcriptional regulator [Verrucomicrobia bacterium]|nr:CopG family transcriptional regulator [Verrucomicrobiota bacterium]
MRTTLDLDDDVLDAARGLAALRKQTLGKVVSDLARQGLRPASAELKVRGGIPVLAKRSGVVVTNDFINRLREQEGI